MNRPENLTIATGEQRHRRDIDGLRAIAVSTVLLFHGGFETFSGGFVGVDVFFVISGYLITGIINRNLQQGRFSLIDFYERRVRRIFPALFAMLALTTAVAFTLFLPADFKNFGISSAAVVFSASNFVFMLQEGYFQPQSELQPLLHTWSLGVEEQFYLVFPVVFALIYRFRQKAIPQFVFAVFGLSFAACVAMTLQWPTKAFYLAPTRAWELMLGAALALGVVRQVSEGAGREAFALLGLAAIVLAVLLFDASTPFPGYAAMLPCLGAAVLIHTASGTHTGSLLSSKWLVRIGLISYSLYLWHWPILVFAKYYVVRELTLAETIMTFVASFIAATLSWRFVEEPFRRKPGIPRQRVFQYAAGVCTVSVVCAGLIVGLKGVPQRLSPSVLGIAAAAGAKTPYRDVCLNRPGRDAASILACRIGDRSARASILLWGDSHADAISPAIDLVAKQTGMSVINATQVSCPPILGVEIIESSQARNCKSWNDAVRRLLLTEDGIKVVILSARWAYYAHGTGYGLDAKKWVKLAGDRPNPMIEGLERTLRSLKDRHVLLILSTPEIKYDVPSSLARLAHSRMAAELRPSLSEHLARQNIVREPFLTLAKKHGVKIIDPAGVLCQDHCDVQVAGHPAYYDSNHLSKEGALVLAPLLHGKL